MKTVPKNAEMKGADYRTVEKPTWCPGCPNHMIMESVRRAFRSLVKDGEKKENFCITAGVGCHGKMFDYLNVSGFYGLHGRPVPLATGIKLGNPNLKVVAFAGDGDTYSEGLQHFMHACRTNPNITLIVHDNQAFSLTTGQATATSQTGFKTKAEPLGDQNTPFNPILLALCAGAGFVARCNARDLDHTTKIIKDAINHKGFSYVEVIQDCLIFNLDINNRDFRMYKLNDKKRTLDEALKLAREYNYELGEGKIPLGIFYKDEKLCLEDKWPQLVDLQKKGIGWKGIKR